MVLFSQTRPVVSSVQFVLRVVSSVVSFFRVLYLSLRDSCSTLFISKPAAVTWGTLVPVHTPTIFDLLTWDNTSVLGQALRCTALHCAVQVCVASCRAAMCALRCVARVVLPGSDMCAAQPCVCCVPSGSDVCAALCCTALRASCREILCGCCAVLYSAVCVTSCCAVCVVLCPVAM